MTERTDIRSGLTNQHPHPSTSHALPYTRRILDRWTERSTASGLPGTEIVTDYPASEIHREPLLSYHRPQRRDDPGLYALSR